MKGFAPSAETFQALVVDEDSLGAWVWIPSGKAKTSEPLRLTLLKWEHFSTARFDYRPEKPVKPKAIGFKS